MAELWDRAIAFLGETAVAFLLDLEPCTRPSAEDRPRWDAVAQIGPGPVDESCLSAEQKLSFRAHWITRTLPGTEQTTVELFRHHVGGRAPVATGDALVDAFVRLAFNGLACEHLHGMSMDRFAMSASFQDPLLHRPAAEAFLRDPDLTKFFPQQDGDVDARGVPVAFGLLTWLPAGGGTTDIRIVVGTVVEQTLARMRFERALEEDKLVDYVRESLDMLRRSARGQEVPIVVLSGLVGIEVAEAIDCGTWGLTPAVGLAIANGDILEEHAPKSVFWLKTTQKLIGSIRNDAPREEIDAAFAHMGELDRSHSIALRRQIRRLQFCIAAWATARAKTVDVTATLHWSLFPMYSAQTPYVVTTRGGHADVLLTSADLVEIADIMTEVGDVTDRLDIALTRIIRASSERRDPGDMLIDAVVAWENMFGSKTETTFKVCAAIAWLLEPTDQAKRLALFNKAKTIYGARSDVVHGAAFGDPDKQPALAREALDIATRAYRAVHGRADLKDLKPSTRAERLLLQL